MPFLLVSLAPQDPFAMKTVFKNLQLRNKKKLDWKKCHTPHLFVKVRRKKNIRQISRASHGIKIINIEKPSPCE